MKRFRIAYAHCCGSSVRICDCTRPNHGTAMVGENEISDIDIVLGDSHPAVSQRPTYVDGVWVNGYYDTSINPTPAPNGGADV